MVGYGLDRVPITNPKKKKKNHDIVKDAVPARAGSPTALPVYAINRTPCTTHRTRGGSGRSWCARRLYGAAGYAKRGTAVAGLH